MVVELKGGFRTLWLLFDSDSSTPHQLFFKEHSVRNQEPEYPKGRTLFVLNVPPWASPEALRKAFAKVCGPVRVKSTPKEREEALKKGFRKIYVVFEREAGLDRALDLQQDTILTLHDKNESESAVGLAKWCKEYNAVAMEDEEKMKKEIEAYMHDYDERVAKRLADEENAGEEDEEGWITVGSKKKRGQFAPSRKESTIDKLQSKEERKNKKKELLNFYTFQIRESKKKNLVELRKKFELDKKRLQQLKSKRTFKPF